MLLIVIAVGMFLFSARTIDVYGNSHHTSEDIASGLTDGILGNNTLYLLWKYRSGSVPDTMPYLNSLHVQMKSPSHLEVQVTEKELVGYVDKGGYACFDQDGVILEITDKAYEDIPIITGASIDDPVLYQKLPTQSSAQLRTILSLTQLLSYQALKASEIRFSENSEITVLIDGVEAQLGQDEYLEEKVANLNKILTRLEGQTGTLHLESFTGRGETVSFTPSDEPETVTDVTNGVGSTQSEADDTADEGSDDASYAEDTAVGDSGAEDDGTVENSGAEDTAEEDSGVIISMVFNSSGTLVYNVHISNGVVVDSYGNEVSGVTINEDGNVVDAYMNVFDATTGELMN